MSGAVVSFDLSLRNTGVGIFSPDGKNPRTFSIHTEKIVSYPLRMSFILKQVLSYVSQDDLVIMEGYAFHAHMNSLTVLAELGGLVKFSLWRRTGVWPLLISPATVKKWITGKGTAKKDDIKLALFKKFGLEFINADEADAFALGDLGWHLFYPKNQLRVLNGGERDILAKIVKDKLKQGFNLLTKV